MRLSAGTTSRAHKFNGVIVIDRNVVVVEVAVPVCGGLISLMVKRVVMVSFVVLLRSSVVVMLYGQLQKMDEQCLMGQYQDMK